MIGAGVVYCYFSQSFFSVFGIMWPFSVVVFQIQYRMFSRNIGCADKFVILEMDRFVCVFLFCFFFEDLLQDGVFRFAVVSADCRKDLVDFCLVSVQERV